MSRFVNYLNMSKYFALLLFFISLGCKTSRILERSEADNTRLREEIRQLESVSLLNVQLEEDLKNTKIQLRKTEDVLSALYLQSKKDSTDIKDVELKINQNPKTSEPSSKIINNLELENKKLNEELTQMSLQKTVISEKQNNAILTINELNNELNLKNKSIIGLNVEIENLRDQIDENIKNGKAEADLALCQEDLGTLKLKNSELETEKDKILEDLDSIKKQIALSKRNNEIDQLEMELKSKNERIYSLETNLDYLNSKLNAANIAVDENIILKKKLEEHVESSNRFLNENQDLKNQINANADKLNKLRQESVLLEKQIEILNQKIIFQHEYLITKSIDSLNKVSFNNYSTKLKRAVDSVQNIHNKYKDSAEKEKNRLENKLETSENKIKTKQNEIQILNIKINNLNTRDSLNKINSKQMNLVKENEVRQNNTDIPKNPNANLKPSISFSAITIKKFNELGKTHSNTRLKISPGKDLIQISFPHEALFDIKSIALSQSGSEILLEVIEALKQEQDLIIHIYTSLKGKKTKLESKEINILRTSTISKLFLAMGIRAQNISFGIESKEAPLNNANEDPIFEISFTK